MRSDDCSVHAESMDTYLRRKGMLSDGVNLRQHGCYECKMTGERHKYLNPTLLVRENRNGRGTYPMIFQSIECLQKWV